MAELRADQKGAPGLNAKLALARGLGALSRRGGGGGTSAPGKLLIRLEPAAIEALAARLPQGSVLVSATNGKTTTTAMAASIFDCTGIRLVHNRAGANMAGGIASTLLEATRLRSGMRGELGLFEVDEAWLGALVQQIHPRAIVLVNLFRDQLDRYGELEAIAERWAETVRAGAGREARLVLNADDPLIADLGRERGALYFGVEDGSLALEGMSHAADAKHCRRCGAPYTFELVLLGHLGHYSCPGCGASRPAPQVSAREVVLDGVRGAAFTLGTPAGEAPVKLALPGLYNIYNALAAAALATSVDIPLERIVAGLQASSPAFGRAESLVISTGSLPLGESRSRPGTGADSRNGSQEGSTPEQRELRIMLIKNPAGANEVLRTLALEPGPHDLLGVLNDGIADGRDVSWIWDVDFELLAGRVGSFTCSGTRAPELALRLKYAGVEVEKIAVEHNLEVALRLAAQRGNGSGPLYALPTYTAMLALRELLVRRGELVSAWS